MERLDRVTCLSETGTSYHYGLKSRVKSVTEESDTDNYNVENQDWKKSGICKRTLLHQGPHD